MYKTDPAMHPNNAAMMVFTSVVVVVVALLPFRAAAAAEGMLRSFRCVPRVLCSAKARVLVKKRVQKWRTKMNWKKKSPQKKEV